MEQPKKTTAETKQRSAKKQVADKLRYIANSRGMKVNEAWASIVAPIVQAEFEACGGLSTKYAAKKG